MHLRSILCRLSVAAVAFGLAWGGAERGSAASFAVDPVEFALTPPLRNATITVSNLAPDPLRIQVTGMPWTEDDEGHMLPAASDGIVVFPQLFTIPPMSTQRIRAAVLVPAGTVETAYRISIEDLPPLGGIVHAKPGSNLIIRTRFLVPLYMEPAARKPAGRITDVRLHDNKLSFAVTNDGNVHLDGQNIEVDGADGAGHPAFTTATGKWHVLAGARRRFSSTVSDAACASIRTITIAPDSTAVGRQTVNVGGCR